MSLPILPFDLQLEIFSYLPCKAVLRFMVLSRLHHSLLLSPDFISRHYSRSRNKSFVVLPSSITSLSDDEDHLNLFQNLMMFPFMRHNFGNNVIGICNGIICMQTNRGILFINPMIRYCFDLPLHDDEDEFTVYAYGFISRGLSDYLVVKIDSEAHYYYYDRDGGEPHAYIPPPCNAWIYIYGEDDWRHLEIPDCSICTTTKSTSLGCNGVVYYGLLHWGAKKWVKDGCYYFILTFDPQTKVFGELLLPDSLATLYHPVNRKTGVFVVQNSNKPLTVYSLIFSEKGYCTAAVWVMDRYGITESWNQIFTFNCTNNYISSTLFGFNPNIHMYVGYPPFLLYHISDECVSDKKSWLFHSTTKLLPLTVTLSFLPPTATATATAMAVASFSNFSARSFSLQNRYSLPLPSFTLSFRTTSSSAYAPLFTSLRSPTHSIIASAHGGGTGGGHGGGGGGGGGGGDGESEDRDRNREEALLVLAEAGRPLEKLPADLAAAVEAGRVPGSILKRFLELEKSAVFRWLLNFGGFKERLLADDLFLAKVAMECGVGIFTKTAAELEKRRENFSKELDFVCADVIMALVADFMLVWLPAPTVSLRPPLAVSAGIITKLFYGCPENAFQVALAGTSYTLIQRIGAIVRNGAKLFAVGTSASLIGTGVTNALINARKVVDKSFAAEAEAEAESVPIISTSVAYGVYMSVSSNLRYQVLAGVIEQRILEPLLHQHKLVLSAICFAVRTGNTFLGSLLWVDYARWVGVQKTRD
ncbi:hypothetical protein VNO80_24010 [Phaseolus coccineus]|uniref:F-box domain-containing protein n=1 Tax=Phaseolus coccineus TaxID=3886 RepID=A0AAN9LS50_PHACN